MITNSSSPFIGRVEAPPLRVLWSGDEFRTAQESSFSEAFLLAGLMNIDVIELLYLEDSSQAPGTWRACPRHHRVVVEGGEDGLQSCMLTVSSLDERYLLPLRGAEPATEEVSRATLQPSGRIQHLREVGDALGVDMIVSLHAERLEYPYGAFEQVRQRSAVVGVADALILVGLYLRSRGRYVWSHFPKDCNGQSSQGFDKVFFYDLAGRYLVNDETLWEIMLGKWDIHHKVSSGGNRLSPPWRRMTRALGNSLEVRDRVHVSLAEAAAQQDLRVALEYHSHAMHALDQFLDHVGEVIQVQHNLRQTIIAETALTGLPNHAAEALEDDPSDEVRTSLARWDRLSTVVSQLRESLDLRSGITKDIFAAMKNSAQRGSAPAMDPALINSLRGSCKGPGVTALVDNLGQVELIENLGIVNEGREQISFEVGRLTESLFKLVIGALNDVMEAIPRAGLPRYSGPGEPQQMLHKVGTSITYGREAFAWMFGVA